MTPLREAVLAKLHQARATLEELLRGDDWGSGEIDWHKGYVKALEEVLDLEGLSLRRSPRRQTHLPVTVVRLDHTAAGGRGEGTILDLSAGGCRLVTPLRVVAGEIVQVTFQLSDASRPFTLEAWVRRAHVVDAETQTGVEFKDPSPEVTGALEAFCAPPAPAGRP